MGKHNRILVVDDDHDILDLLQYNLEKEGFKVKAIDDSMKALDILLQFRPNLVILDIMMPNMNGIELCRHIRELPRYKDTFIFFLTARSEFYFQEAAWDTGGDDFIEKIIGLRALTSKVVSVLKKDFIIRKREREIRIGSLQINRTKSLAILRGREIPLSKPELELLFFFAQNPDKEITDENLLNNIWGSETYSIGSSLDAYLGALSKKLGSSWITHPGEHRYRFRPQP